MGPITHHGITGIADRRENKNHLGALESEFRTLEEGDGAFRPSSLVRALTSARTSAASAGIEAVADRPEP